MRDAHGTTFRPETDYALDLYPQKPSFLEHTMRGWFGRAGVVVQDAFQKVAEGLYGEIDLDDNDYGERALEMVRAARGYFSIGWMPHQFEATPGGDVIRAALVEVSVVSNPSAPRPRVTARHLRMAGMDVGDLADDIEMRFFMFPPNNGTNGQSQPPQPTPSTPAPVPPPAIPALPSQPIDFQAALTALQQTQQAMQQQVQEIAHLRSLPAAAPVPVAPEISVTSKYDDVTMLGMMLWDVATRRRAISQGHFRPRDEVFMRALVDKMAKARIADEKQPDGVPLTASVFTNPLRSIDAEAAQAWRKYLPNLRSDEAMQSTLAGYGDELVPTLLSSVAHYQFRMATKIMSLFQSFNMPSNPFDYPVISGGPTIRRVSQAADQTQFSISGSPYPVTKPETSKKTFSAGKIGAMVLATRELYEEAGLNVADVVARNVTLQMAEAIDSVLLNGDETTGTGNISYLGTDPVGTVADKFLVLDGLRHNFIVDTTSDGSNAAGVVTIALTSLAILQALMGTRGKIGTDVQNLVTILDLGAYYKLLNVADFQTMEKIGNLATILTGQVGQWNGTPVVVTDQIDLLDSAGKIPAAANGTLGTYMIVHRLSYLLGLLRGVNMEVFDVPWADGIGVVADVRMDIQRMEVGGIAGAYNVTV